MKKQFTKRLMAGLAATLCCASFVVAASAASSSDIQYRITAGNYGSQRAFTCETATPYTCTWVRATSEAQQYPSGSALLGSYSTTENNASYAGHFRTAGSYKGQMTVYGAHSMYTGGKSYIRYTTTPNV